MHILLAGLSTRAAAESAARAGFAVTAVDAFGDLDQHVAVRALPLPRPFTALAAARAARTIRCEAVAYLGGFENHCHAVSVLAGGRALWGNPPSVLRCVRDPLLLAQALHRRGFPVPAVCAGPRSAAASIARPAETGITDRHRHPDLERRQWLVKPFASGGGHGVQLWDGTTPVPSSCYLQERLEGTPGSVVFVATGGRAVPLGVSAQLVGEAAFGTAGYRYCGNILATSPSSDMALVKHACALTAAVADEFQLVGVNGIDFIARGSVPHPIEVNPRWCASMELVERAYGLSVFGAHAAACTAGTLPEFDVGCARSRWGAVGKAVVFARRTVTVGDTRAWLPAEVSSVVGRGRREVDETGLDDLGASIRDVPHPGGRIEAGRPVCTVFAAGRDVAECRKVLIRRAEEIFAQLAQWEG